MLNGKNAEQLRPAKPKADSPPVSVRTRDTTCNAMASRNGRATYIARTEILSESAANNKRPNVTMAQKAVSAHEAACTDTPRCDTRYTLAQLPFSVSRIP